MRRGEGRHLSPVGLATYTGIMDDLRQAFAKANEVSASLFSFDSEAGSSIRAQKAAAPAARCCSRGLRTR